jgi:ferredoxin
MPQISINGKSFEAEQGKRLVLAIEESGVKIGHRCGGFARCTTCRVVFEEGEPKDMTVAEFTKLSSSELLGEVRLSCQIVCEHDMKFRPVMTAENQPDWNGDTGPTPEPTVTPEPIWYPVEVLKKEIGE